MNNGRRFRWKYNLMNNIANDYFVQRGKIRGYAKMHLVEELRYNTEGRGLDS